MRCRCMLSEPDQPPRASGLLLRVRLTYIQRPCARGEVVGEDLEASAVHVGGGDGLVLRACMWVTEMVERVGLDLPKIRSSSNKRTGPGLQRRQVLILAQAFDTCASLRDASLAHPLWPGSIHRPPALTPPMGSGRSCRAVQQ